MKEYVRMFSWDSSQPIVPYQLNRDMTIKLVTEVLSEEEATIFSQTFAVRYSVKTNLRRSMDGGYIVFADVKLYRIMSNFQKREEWYLFTLY